MNQSQEVSSQFFKMGSKSPAFFETVDEFFDHISFFVGLFIESVVRPFLTLFTVLGSFFSGMKALRP